MNTNTETERTYLQAVNREGEEQFMLVTLDWAMGSIKRTSGPMSEAEFREDFKSRGMPDDEIDMKLAAARKSPVD